MISLPMTQTEKQVQFETYFQLKIVYPEAEMVKD